jgi:hypothetical protein
MLKKTMTKTPIGYSQRLDKNKVLEDEVGKYFHIDFEDP